MTSASFTRTACRTIGGSAYAHPVGRGVGWERDGHARGSSVSTVTTVPETHRQGAGDARDQLRKTGTMRLMRDAAIRFRAADGTSYARALGHSSVLTLIPAVIAVIGLVTTFDMVRFRGVLEDAATSFAPGPAGGILTEALANAGPSSGPTALVAGLVGLLVLGHGRDDPPRAGGESDLRRRRAPERSPSVRPRLRDGRHGRRDVDGRARRDRGRRLDRRGDERVRRRPAPAAGR